MILCDKVLEDLKNKYSTINEDKDKLKIYIIDDQVMQTDKDLMYKIIISDETTIFSGDIDIQKRIMHVIADTDILKKYINIVNHIRNEKKLYHNYFLGTLQELLSICKIYIDKVNIKPDNSKTIQESYILKNNTIKNHEGNLKVLQKIINIDNIDETALKIIDDLKKSDATKKNYIAALKYYYRINKKDSDTLMLTERLLNTSMEKYCQQIDTFIKSNTKSIVQSNNFISWSRVLEISERLFILSKENHLFEYYSIILALYVKMYPRRITDYSNLHYAEHLNIIDNAQILYLDHTQIDQNIMKPVHDIDGTKNYFGKHNNMYVFVFNNYKTNFTYKKQIIEVNTELANMIMKYIQQNKIVDDQNIFNLTDAKLKYTLQKIFEVYENKKISASMLRHIYLSDNIDTQNIREREIIGLKMGHSISMQQKYIKYDYDNINPLSPNLDISRENKLLGGKGCRKKYKNDDEIREARKRNTKKYRMNKKQKKL